MLQLLKHDMTLCASTPMLLLVRRINKMVLSGEGSDEMFAAPATSTFTRRQTAPNCTKSALGRWVKTHLQLFAISRRFFELFLESCTNNSHFFRLKIFINLIAFGSTRAWWRGALNLECHSSTVSFSNTPWTWIRCWRCAVIERKSVGYGWIDNALKEVAKTTISDLQMRFAFHLSPLSSTSLYVLTNLICHWSVQTSPIVRNLCLHLRIIFIQ